MAGKPPGLSTPSSSAGTPTAAAGSKRRRSSDKEEPKSSSLSQPLADFVSAEPCTYEPLPKNLEKGKVQDICKNFPSLIPPDALARQQDLDVLTKKGFNFTINKQLGAGKFGAIYECSFSGQHHGQQIDKILACKRVVINNPDKMGWTIKKMEQKMQREMKICEIVIANQNKNIAKHELMWQIKDATIDYKNPIIHLIFMEKCEGSLKDFIIQNYGYSTIDNLKTNIYTGAVPEIVNKIWMYHVCQGLDFLHDQNKKDKQGNERWYSIIHHDLKHDNILYQMHGDQIKFMICDFGLSEMFEFPSDESRDQRISSMGTAGSQRFSSPIPLQIRDEFEKWKVNRIGNFQPTRDYEVRKKDVYALGVMLSDCLFGFNDPATSQNNSEYDVANEWLVNSLRRCQIIKYFSLIQLKKVSKECVQLIFKLASVSEPTRPLVSTVLANDWFKDVRSTPPFVDYKAMSGSESGTK